MTHTPDPNPETTDSTPHEKEPADQELVMFLEPDQLMADTSVPVPRAPLSKRANTGLWALRIFIILISIMVIYTFAANLK
jgi:hypothetical protein